MSKLDLLQGTLDLMVLQTLAAVGPLHGYGIGRRIEQESGSEVLLNQGTIHASLVRLEQRGWIVASWGVSRNKRRAKFFAINQTGRMKLLEGAGYWERSHPSDGAHPGNGRSSGPENASAAVPAA